MRDDLPFIFLVLLWWMARCFELNVMSCIIRTRILHAVHVLRLCTSFVARE